MRSEPHPSALPLFKGHMADASATWWAALKASEMTG
jgi:hypothetical protein